MPTIALLGTMDTKGTEYGWVKQRLQELGCSSVLIDCGIFDPALIPDIDADTVARAAGSSLTALRDQHDRGAAMSVMANGAGAVLTRLLADGDIDGVLALGGSGGSSIAGTAMQQLPIGVPKLLVSTMASGDVGPYVGTADVTLMYSIVDIAGINSISRKILGNAAAAVAGMASSDPRETEPATTSEKQLIAASMFGVTTTGVTAARDQLEELGYEVLVFHATGSGGRSMERLITSGFFAGVLDLTTTELADELVGGVLSAGASRLDAAGKKAVPQVVSLGALDMVNFGPLATVPEAFRQRQLHVHNDTITLMRTTKDENETLGRIIGAKLRAATGQATLFVPLHGLSALDISDGPFWDPDADSALLQALRGALADSAVDIIEVEASINDRTFAVAAAEELDRLIKDPNPRRRIQADGISTGTPDE